MLARAGDLAAATDMPSAAIRDAETPMEAQSLMLLLPWKLAEVRSRTYSSSSRVQGFRSLIGPRKSCVAWGALA
jgi:hypothetical protein